MKDYSVNGPITGPFGSILLDILLDVINSPIVSQLFSCHHRDMFFPEKIVVMNAAVSAPQLEGQ